MADSTAAGSLDARGFFIPDNRAAIMRQRIGKPTGVTLTAGDVVFDLVPLNSEDGEQVFDLIQKGWMTFAKWKAGGLTDEQLFLEIRQNIPEVENFTKMILKRAAGIEDGDKEQGDLFDLWWKGAPYFIILSQLMTSIMSANGFANAAASMAALNPQKPAQTEAETPAPA